GAVRLAHTKSPFAHTKDSETTGDEAHDGDGNANTLSDFVKLGHHRADNRDSVLPHTVCMIVIGAFGANILARQ
ncbi:hypothetical protein SARC_17553, partial [Sphaeroforma arctica JP610]